MDRHRVSIDKLLQLIISDFLHKCVVGEPGTIVVTHGQLVGGPASPLTIQR